MIKNYLKIAFRSLKRQQSYTIINILGLAIGLACFMIIIQYVGDELGYDKWHEKGDRIYRVALERKYPGRVRNYAIIPQSYAEAMKTEFPEVEETCRFFFFAGNPFIIKHNNILYEESNYMWSDSTFFKMFDVKLLRGNPETALSQPNGIVLTESHARKYFGEEDALGQTLELPQNNNINKLIVTGVCEDVPENSHFDFDVLLSVAALGFLQQPNYINFSAYTYLLLREGADPNILESKFPELVVKYASGQILNNFGVDYPEYQKQGNGYLYSLQALPDLYLDSKLEAELKPPGSRQRVYFFLVISILILVIACINFMNLATARSASRAKEVGIRKTLGSARSQIAFQFFTEAILVSSIAAVIALIIHHMALPYFNELTGKTFNASDLSSLSYLSTLVIVALVTGVLSGLYPSLALSSYKPIEVLRGQFSKTRKGSLLRNVLVVFQFSISVFLIISTIFVYQQMLFTQNKELGFDKEHLITLQGAGGMQVSEEETFKSEIRKLPGVVAVSGCSTQPGEQYFGVSFKPPQDNEMTTGSGIFVDDGYVECMEMEIVAGRSFSEDFADSLSLILNEAAVREMGLQDPIGKQVMTPDQIQDNLETGIDHYTIVGVIKDFHFQSLHQEISPLFLMHNQKSFIPGVDNLITVRLEPNAIQNSLSLIENIWNRFQPDLPFRYAFLDRDWANLYEREVTARKVFSVFSLLAIFIACLGLLALAAFTAEQRIKEIGIRKVLGATSASIVGLLSKDFLKLVIISIIIASPLAWISTRSWLNDFAYRIDITLWVFILAGIIAILIAFLTVSFQSIKAANANPVDALKLE